MVIFLYLASICVVLATLSGINSRLNKHFPTLTPSTTQSHTMTARTRQKPSSSSLVLDRLRHSINIEQNAIDPESVG